MNSRFKSLSFRRVDQSTTTTAQLSDGTRSIMDDSYLLQAKNDDKTKLVLSALNSILIIFPIFISTNSNALSRFLWSADFCRAPFARGRGRCGTQNHKSVPCLRRIPGATSQLRGNNQSRFSIDLQHPVYLPTRGPVRPKASSPFSIAATRKWAARCCTGDDP